MRCPFLREAQVKFCQASAFKKMIVRTPAHTENERCSSPEYIHCPAAKFHHEELPSQSHCPFLQESLAQYCAAAATKYVPYSESLLSRCGNESHRYCELFVALAHPETEGDASAADESPETPDMKEHTVEGIRMPGWLSYSANHMWLDVSEDGCCHVGIDALLAKVLGHVERISFVTARGAHRPAAVLTVNGVDVQIVFPNPMTPTATNAYLRANPEKLTAEPYTAGWLFEGKSQHDAPKGNPANVAEGLIRKQAARKWMADEMQRLSAFAHEQYSQQHGVMMDGGTFTTGLALHLTRDEILHLFNEFFSPYASWRSQR